MKLVFIVTISFIALGLSAQSCPDPATPEDAPHPSTLHGTLRYHDELRQWLELKLDHPACGEDQVQLVFKDTAEWRRAKSFDSCRATITGELYEGVTGYYSANIAMMDPSISPDPDCRKAQVEPDPASAPRKKGLSQYDVEIKVDYRGRGHIAVTVWENRIRRIRLSPWQRYANYWLTGGRDVLWVGCEKPFALSRFVQTPKPESDPVLDEHLGTQTVLNDTAPVNTISFHCSLPANK